MSEVINFNPDEWTIGDLDEFETLTGLTLDEAFEPTTVRRGGEVERDEKGRPIKAVRMSAKVILAIVYITKRADNPEFTLDDARKVKVAALNMAGSDSPEASSAATAN